MGDQFNKLSLKHYYRKPGADEHDYIQPVALIDRAHHAPLQAELARMNAMFDELATAVGFSKERCEQAGDSPLDCANQLQAELERLKDEAHQDGILRVHYGKEIDQLKARRDELEALLLEVRKKPGFFSGDFVLRIDAALSKAAGSAQGAEE